MKTKLSILCFVAIGAAGLAQAEPVLVMSAKEPAVTLTTEQAADIFLGKAATLPNGAPVVAVDQVEGAPVRDDFHARVTGKNPAQLKAHWSKVIFTGKGHPPATVANDEAVKKFVAQTPHALGYIDKSALDASLRVVLSVR